MTDPEAPVEAAAVHRDGRVTTRVAAARLVTYERFTQDAQRANVLVARAARRRAEGRRAKKGDEKLLRHHDERVALLQGT